ncbi:MAG TPA: hypothetical protein VEC57_15035 [Candidatus Limnocylindrales bacterium]|nr:hypothetical protein [Candidatus Limnocylindrales bacterium]
MPLAVAALVQQLRKMGLQITREQEARLEHYARLAAAEAEEWASQRLRASIVVHSADKLERAIASLVDKVPGITRDEALRVIHAQLPAIGAGAAAALSDLRRAAANGVR